MTPVGPSGEVIMEYSIYDALRAGFDRVVFIIKEELYEVFHQAIGQKVEKLADTQYVFQKIEDIPPRGITPPSGRKKPWGTGHAVLSCKEAVHTPFAVINADDFYGGPQLLKCSMTSSAGKKMKERSTTMLWWGGFN